MNNKREDTLLPKQIHIKINIIFKGGLSSKRLTTIVRQLIMYSCKTTKQTLFSKVTATSTVLLL